MKTLLRNLFDFEREDTFGERLFFRIFEAIVLYFILTFAWEWGFYILKIGDVVLPLGIANHLDVSFMFGHKLSLLNAAAITGMMAMGFFRLWRFGYLAALLLLHLQYAARYSLGEISHGSNVMGMALLAMALGAVFFAGRRHARRFTFGFLYFFLGLGYVLAAGSKLIGTGPGWVDGRHLWMWIAERTVDTFSLTGVVEHNWFQLLVLDFFSVATMILTFGLLTEFFAFLMWFRRTRPWIMTLLIMMHLGVLLTMKINFPANTVLLILLAYPWGLWLDRGRALLDASFHTRLTRPTLRHT
jgi:hypothetical protein